MDEADAEHCTGPREPRILERGAVVSIEHIRNAAVGDRPAQQILARPGVLVRVEHAVDQEPRSVVDDQEQLGAHRRLLARVGHPRSDQDVGHPALVRTLCLVAAEDTALC